MREDRQEWTVIATFHKPSTYSLVIESTPDGVIRYTFDSNRPEDELRSFFL